MLITAHLFLDILFDLSILAMITRLGWILARPILRPVGWFPLLVSAGLGCWGLSVLVFLFASLGLWRLPVVALVGAVFFVLAWLGSKELKSLRSLYRPLEVPFSTAEKTLLFLILVAGAFQLFFNYAPPTGDDELVYHISLPQLYCLTGHFTETPAILNGYFPLNAELISTAVLLTRGVLAVKAMVWIEGLLLLLALYVFSREQLKMNRFSALLACTLLELSSFFTSLSGSVSSDFLMVFFEILCVGLLWQWKKSPRPGLVVVMGLLAGAAMGTRPYALLGIVAIGVTMLAVRRDVRPALGFGLIALAVYSPWPIRNAVLTGNPFYPGAFWHGAAEDVYARAMAHDWTHAPPLKFLFELPFFVSCQSFIWSLGPLPLTFLPWAYARKDRTLVWLLTGLAGISLFLLAFLVAAPSPRYGGQSYPWIVLLAALGFEHLSLSLSRPARRVMFGAVILSLIVPNLCFAIYMGGKRLPFVLGRQSADEYLQMNYHAEGYAMMKFLQHQVDPDRRVLFLGFVPGTSAFYYPGRPFISMAQYRPAFYTDVEPVFVQHLQQEKIRYVLFSKQSFVWKDRYWFLAYLPSLQITLPALIPPHFVLVYDAPESTLYEVLPNS